MSMKKQQKKLECFTCTLIYCKFFIFLFSLVMIFFFKDHITITIKNKMDIELLRRINDCYENKTPLLCLGNLDLETFPTIIKTCSHIKILCCENNPNLDINPEILRGFKRLTSLYCKNTLIKATKFPKLRVYCNISVHRVTEYYFGPNICHSQKHIKHD